jgi:glycine dehydrogenase
MYWRIRDGILHIRLINLRYPKVFPFAYFLIVGRLESLLNFQTVITELTGLPLANASLLDEGTAAAEAMAMAFAGARMKKTTFIVDTNVYPQTAAVIRGRAEGLGIKVVETDISDPSIIESKKDDLIGVLIQYPRKDGKIVDYTKLSESVHSHGGQLICAADLLSLTLLAPPSTFNADIVVGSAQRFGVPMGFGGPHAAFFACSDANKRKLPGRLVGVSKDRLDGRAFRLSLQTREQHIRREKATSNICTSQALLANMSAFYAVYHGPDVPTCEDLIDS